MIAADVQPYRCDAEHARELTDQIRAGVEKVHQLLVRSYEWEAWKALGYVSWRDYAMTEFGISQSRAYRLLDQARVIKEIEAVAVSPIGENLTEGQTRVLAPIIRDHGPEAAAEVLAAATESGKPTAAAIRQAAEDTGRARVTTTTTEVTETETTKVVDTTTGEIIATVTDLHSRTPAPPAGPRRRPLPDAFFAVSHDLGRMAKSLHNLTTDDRWSRNAEQVTRYRNDLLRTRDLIDQVLAAMPNNNAPEG